MNEPLPPLPDPSQQPPPFDPAHIAAPPKKSHKTRNILLGCGLALLLGIGLFALICISVCSQMGNMH